MSLESNVQPNARLYTNPYAEWSGDNEFFANEGGYEFIAGHLRFMDSSM